MNTTSLLILAATAALTLFAGCVTAPGPFQPLDTTKYTLENTDKFVLLDKLIAAAAERPYVRLEVVANVKNRESRRLEVQINCVFKDELNASTGDETPFQTLILTDNSTEAVRFTAMNSAAKKYTIRVRQAR